MGGRVLGFLVAVAIVALVLILHIWDQGLLGMYRFRYEPPLSRARGWLRLVEAAAVGFGSAALFGLLMLADDLRPPAPPGSS